MRQFGTTTAMMRQFGTTTAMMRQFGTTTATMHQFGSTTAAMICCKQGALACVNLWLCNQQGTALYSTPADPPFMA